MKFTFELIGTGWADVMLDIGENRFYAAVSYLNEPLHDLCHGLLRVIPGLMHEDEQDEQESSVTFDWNLDPAGAQWHLSYAGNDRLRVKVVLFDDMDKKDPGESRVKIDNEVDVFDFVEAVVTELDQLLKNHGLVGYRDTWYRQDFPLTAYLKLKHFWQTKEAFEVREVTEEGHKEVCKSSLAAELETLQKLL
ncbi:hypothetical protein [Brevibacillus dissolubilis]|uniref:hypothetical protein n=1 Tax=Brevibacillus dissolubilis TaxID=1844116 RepID=UPI00111649D0|nr:hypothetical protein [Brevibacillus dissolubilis]